jgi:hypothetical protein
MLKREYYVSQDVMKKIQRCSVEFTCGWMRFLQGKCVKTLVVTKIGSRQNSSADESISREMVPRGSSHNPAANSNMNFHYSYSKIGDRVYCELLPASLRSKHSNIFTICKFLSCKSQNILLLHPLHILWATVFKICQFLRHQNRELRPVVRLKRHLPLSPDKRNKCLSLLFIS